MLGASALDGEAGVRPKAALDGETSVRPKAMLINDLFHTLEPPWIMGVVI